MYNDNEMMEGEAEGGMEGYDTKKKLLCDMMAWADHGRAQDLKAKYASQPSTIAPQEEPHVQVPTIDGVITDKASVIGPDGLPAESPSLLLSDLDDEAIRKLLGG